MYAYTHTLQTRRTTLGGDSDTMTIDRNVLGCLVQTPPDRCSLEESRCWTGTREAFGEICFQGLVDLVCAHHNPRTTTRLGEYDNSNKDGAAVSEVERKQR